ncbi:MAG: hypothetical protein WCY56_02705 [Aminobacteriaceae bacterium]
MNLWFTIPPLLSLPISLFLMAFGRSTDRISIGAPLWFLFLLLYLALSLAYAFSVKQMLFSRLLPLQMAAQGVLICIVSLEAGTPPIIPWVGVAIGASGFASIASLFSRRGQPMMQPNGQGVFAEDTSEAASGQIAEDSPFPTVTTDPEGIIIHANSAFKELSEDEAPEGKSVTEFFVPGNQEETIGGKSQLVFQKNRDGLFYFTMADPPKTKTAKAAASSKGGVELFDPATGLYTKEYSRIRGPEELSRAARYRRWLCGVLLQLSYTNLPGFDGRPDLEETFFIAYVQYFKSEVRDSDMGFNLGARTLLLLLPETPQQGAKDTSIRLITLPEPLMEMKKDYPFSVNIEYGLHYYSGNHQMSFEQFTEKLYSSLAGEKE